MAQGGEAPRILSIDDYFMSEVEREVADEERKGRKRKVTEMEYLYEQRLEGSWLAPLQRHSALHTAKSDLPEASMSRSLYLSVE